MNSTNRALNRAFVFVIGAILLSAGGAGIALATVPAWANAWRHTAPMVRDSVDSAVKNTAVIGDQSWILIALPAACLVLIALLLVFVFRQGRGRTTLLLDVPDAVSRDSTTEGEAAKHVPYGGGLRLDASLAEQVIEDDLATRTELLSSDVSTFLVKGLPALRITASPRRGVSPQTVQRIVESTLRSWDAALGREVPAFVHVSAGLRARVTRPTRTH